MKKITLLIVLSIFAWGNIGTIMALKGKVMIQRDDFIDAQMGMDIMKGDRVLTSKKSRMQVILKDKTVITIGANSSFDFKEYAFDGSKNSKLNFKANKGYFRSLTGKIGKIAPERFKIKTISATIGVRGTDFDANITEDNEIIHCYSGAIWVKFDKGGVKNILSGMQLDIARRPPPFRNPMQGGVPMRNDRMMPHPKLPPNNLSEISTEIVKPEDLPPKPEGVLENTLP